MDEDVVGHSSGALAPQDDAASLLLVRGVLVLQMSPEPTDRGIRELRERVGTTIVERHVRGLAVDLGRTETMDTYLTRCVRDIAVGARLMGVPTVICGLRPAVAETVVDMGLTLEDVPAARDLDDALVLLGRMRSKR